MTPDDYCQDRATRSGSSFYYAFLFLPQTRRRAITALYAFCREVDDAVDEPHERSVAQAKLTWWRGEVLALSKGEPTHPVTRALAPFMGEFDISIERLMEIIDGMQMDLDQSRYLDFIGLKTYCYRVASVVGILAAGIFGPRDEAVKTYAENLGLAFQLTNIIRDVGEDARRDRIYLPMDELQQFGVPVSDIRGAKYSDNFAALMKFQAERARGYYAAARAALPAKQRKAQRPGLIMAAIYETLLDELERDGFHVLHQKISLTPIRKLWLAWSTWIGLR